MPSWFNSRVQLICALAILAVAGWIMLFNRLDAAPIRTYDEVRLANNAIEMAQTGDLIVTQYNGKPEYWNTKPPLMIWLQAVSVKVLGLQTPAFRLPAALAAFATVLVLFLFMRRQLNEVWIPLLAVLLLLSTDGYVLEHCARQGEYDSLLVLWILASSLTFFQFVHNPEQRRWLWLTALFVVLAVYTKGIQGVLHLPGLVIYAAVARRFRSVFGQWRLYAAAGVSLGVIAAYYLVRNGLQSDYLLFVWENEVMGRYRTVIEGHEGDFFYYFLQLKSWGPVVLAALPTLLIMRGRDRQLAVFSLVVSIAYLLVISFSKSKLAWYEAPVYPFMALFVAFGVKAVVERARQVRDLRAVIIGLTAFVTVWLFAAMARAVDADDVPRWREEYYGDQLERFFRQYPQTRNVVFLFDEYEGPALYHEKYYESRGIKLHVQRSWTLDLQPRDTVLTSEPRTKAKLQRAYDSELIFGRDGMEGHVIIGKPNVIRK